MEKPDAWLLTNNLHLKHGRADPFSAAIRSSRMAMVIVDANQPDLPIIFANDSFLRLTGYERDEVTGRNCRFLQGPDTDPEAVAKIRVALRDNLDIAIDILNYRKDGSSYWNSLYLSPVFDEEGVTQYFFSSQFDSTERKQHEFSAAALQQDLENLVMSRTSELEQALQRSNLLLHEVDHRVKNNLQMISAMLMLQSMSITDDRIRKTLREMLERVDALGMVHKRLYQSGDAVSFDVSEFTREIANNLLVASGRDDIDLKLETETVNIRADSAASIALIINETITNALKHAFPSGQRGSLRVKVQPVSDKCQICVHDDGVGMIDRSETKSNFGKTLVETLVKQLKANIEWLPSSVGTHVRITMPIHE